MSTLTALLTAEDFAKHYADTPFCELVRGEVIELTAGGLRHSRISGRAYYLLETWAIQSGLGRAYTNETGLLTERGPDTVRGADAVYFSFRRLPPENEPEGFSSVPPELVVEVVGKGQGWNAMVAKAGEYLAMGVDRVWVLDADTTSLYVFGGDEKPVELSGEAEVRDEKLLPGFSCRVSDFFNVRRGPDSA